MPCGSWNPTEIVLVTDAKIINDKLIMNDPTATNSPSREELLRRAEALVPVLRERALATEELRRLPPETVEDLRRSDLVSVVQPASGGGLERSFVDLLEVTATVSRGCGSAGWCLGVMAVHNWLLGLFPEEAQKEVFEPNPRPTFAAVFAPMGKAEPTDGGSRLSGRWSFASGCDNGDWVAVCGVTQGDAPDLVMHLVPKSDFRIDDTWFVSGLRGTGSKDIVVEDAFVPAHRTLSLIQASIGSCPGHAINEAPLFKVAFTGGLILALTGAGLGIAEGALDHFQEQLKSRVMVFDGREQKQQPAAQMRLAESAAEIDAARMLILDAARRMDEGAAAGTIPDEATRVRYRRNAAFAARLCARAVDRLFEASGGSGLRDQSPLQRAFRDVHAAGAHAILAWDTAAEIAGRHMVGLDLKGAMI